MSISDICEKYSIESVELEDIKYELKQLLKKAHPDNNNGECDTDYFENLKIALEVVEQEIVQKNPEKSEIQVLSNVLANALQNTFLNCQIARPSESEKLEEKLELAIKNHAISIKAKTCVKRYSLASITAVITFLWLLPEKIMSHPIFAGFFGYNDVEDYSLFSIAFLVIWLYFLLLTILYWKQIFDMEQIEKQILEQIKLKNIQNHILMSFLRELEADGENTFSREVFEEYIRKEVVRMIMDMLNIKSKMRRIKYRMRLLNEISETVIQNIVDIILLNAEEHKVICKLEKRSLIDYYRVIEE